MTSEIRPYRPDDMPRIAEMRREAFRQPVRPGPWERSGGRVFTVDGQIIATTLVDPLGQFFGGRSVPSAAVSAVVVDPRYRGQGVGSRLLQAMLAEQRALGMPLAVLYPSVVGVYRWAGFEFAGAHMRFRAPARAVPSDGDPGVLQRWTDDDLPEVNAGYRRAAQGSAGQLDRSPEWWQERLLIEASGTPLYRYLVRDAEGVAGHVLYTQQTVAGRYGYDVQVRDLSRRTLPAARALLALVAANQPFGNDVQWTGPIDEPLQVLFDDVAPAAEWYFTWMLRVLNVRTALECRGYPPELSTEATIGIDDPWLPENNATYHLRIANGQASVDTTHLPAPRVAIGPFSSLYSGWNAAHTLVRLGLLTDADTTTLNRLTSIFAGPKPWMTEII